ncbi:hypothetical protein OP10G_4597 [Fimbriimonas ginsengisoli Gsoil 348]|uniref:Uncharacterized protein n=1 Tax=Fimbriimonas ginsengisoli Gsoil 348 TaxID=661478 RepID=A0A068NYA4_FIMGI|nr:hypothetical protein OP10G_4597 [Fimbriimonas ginsengisoli Gsoil 348]
MCPVCVATTAWLVAGTTSAGGVTGFIATKIYKKTRPAKAAHAPLERSKEK